MSMDHQALSRAVAEHGRVVRVAITQARGSTPRDAGTEMLIWRGGQSGTIGGGELEHRATRTALDQIDRDIAQSSASYALGPALGQCCGGAVGLSFQLFTAATLPEGAVTATDQAAPAPLWIFGAGHVGRALIDVIAPLPDFAITWVDTAPERFPGPVPGGVAALPAARPEIAIRHAPPAAHHLILTYSHEIDFALCHAVLGQHFASCGLIGSATKWARFQSRLRALGHQPAQISRIACPIGDPGLGKHPRAIAIGVASGLLGARMHEEPAHSLRRISR